MDEATMKAVEEFTATNLSKKGLYHYNDMQDAFLIGYFKAQKNIKDDAIDCEVLEFNSGDRKDVGFISEVPFAFKDLAEGEKVKLVVFPKDE